MSDYERFMRGYAMMGELPDFTDSDYVIMVSQLLANGFITGLNWNTEIGGYLKLAIDAQPEELKAKMIEWGSLVGG